MKKTQYISMLMTALLAACHSGNNTSNIVVANDTMLAQYKEQLKYTAPSTGQNNFSLRNPANTRQQSFIAPTGGITLNSIRVTLFSSTDCSYGSELQLVTMNGGSGVTFAAGTYTSTDASNMALAGRFIGESAAAFAAQSVRFDYGYNAVGDQESGWVSANCIESGIGNFDPHPPEVCSDGQPCGFNRLQIVNLPESFLPAIFATVSTFNGNLKQSAENLGALGVTGFTGADLLCNMDSAKPYQGAGSRWKALLAVNNSTVSGINYYRADYQTLIAQADGTNLRGFGAVSALESSIVGGDAFAPVWTGFTPSMDATYSGWTDSSWPDGSQNNSCGDWESSAGDHAGVYGMATSLFGQDRTDPNPPTPPSPSADGWGITTVDNCGNQFSLYCVQQSN